ncbi:Histone deacetylase 6, partial [Fragariocoptes setiger]
LGPPINDVVYPIIKCLDKTVVNKIAAGEIIHRPVNAVKEMIENSLDAGATNIQVIISNGGLDGITIIDNGHGIARENAELLCRRYSTSKLDSIESLRRMVTYGFRGEALASISAVSTLHVTSYCKQADSIGWEATYTNGTLIELPKDKSLPHCGTQFSITNLFDSGTNRKCTLQSIPEERRLIHEMMTRYAIHLCSRVTMSLRESNSSDNLLCSIAPMDIRSCIGSFFGIDVEKNSIPIEAKDERRNMSATLVISAATTIKRFVFILFVNGRLVDCPELKGSIDQVLTDHYGHKSTPFVYASLQVNPHDLDVNAHPSKTYVVLHYQNEMNDLICDKVKARLTQTLDSQDLKLNDTVSFTQISLTDIIETPIFKKKTLLNGSSVIKQKASPAPKDEPLSQPSNSSQNFDESRVKLLAPAALSQSPVMTKVRPSHTIHNDHKERKLTHITNFSAEPMINVYDSPEVRPTQKSMLSDVTSQPAPIRRQLKLKSVLQLRSLVTTDIDKPFTNFLRESSYVGTFSSTQTLVQRSTKLYVIDFELISSEIYYQVYLFNFGDFDRFRIDFCNVNLDGLISFYFSFAAKHDIDVSKMRYKTPASVMKILLSHKEMLSDYFSLDIEESGVKSLPVLVHNYSPNLTYLPKFLVETANRVNWSNEIDCFRTFGRVLADFYAQPPCCLYREADRKRWHQMIERILFPFIKQYLHVPMHLFDSGCFKKVADTEDLYKELAEDENVTIRTWNKKRRPTGLVFDDSMKLHDCLWIDADESPQRYDCILQRFKELNLVNQCQLITPRSATKEEILLAHSEEYYEQVAKTKTFTGPDGLEQLKEVSSNYDGVYFNEHTYDVAMLAAGSCIELAEAVMSDKLDNGFALVRTPGHHAMRNEANGYCIFNNASIVAKNAIAKYGRKRVLIIDWDIHHGQGTQSFFYDDDRVMYVSIHRYELGKFWPELIESNYNFTGANAGKGYNINVPLNELAMTDGDFLAIWFNLIMPIATEFNPEFVIVSAGYDAAIGDPEGLMRLKPVTYHIMCHSLMSLANGRLVCLLEGGYNLLSLAEGAMHTLRALLGYPCSPLNSGYLEFNMHESARNTILDAIWALRHKWKSLCLQGEFTRQDPDSAVTPGGSETRPKYLPVVEYQGTVSYAEEKPTSYDINGVKCEKNFEQQAALNDEILKITANTDLGVPECFSYYRTQLLFHEDMDRHECTSSHPERPARCRSFIKSIKASGLVERCQIGNPRRATIEELSLVHSIDYIKKLEQTQSMSKKELTAMARKCDSIYLNQHSYDCALLAAGCALEAVESVMERRSINAFVMIRPPGHHAGKDYAAGFCFFNNVVVAGYHALKRYPNLCKKVLIFDYDVHHGDGVQKLVAGDDRFLYISLHRFDDGAAYPGTQLSNYKTGNKNIINIPWNDHIMTETEYMIAMFNIVLPCAYEFNPDLVLISSGFDAATNDPLGQYKVNPTAYSHFIHHLMPLASGKLVVCLEGGYDLEAISKASTAVLCSLLGDSPEPLKMNVPSEAAKITMRNVISYQKSFYKCLAFDVDLPNDELAGKVVWITGASSGIGEYVAYELAKSGCLLALSGTDEVRLNTVRQLGGGNEKAVLVVPFNITDFNRHKACMDKVLHRFSKIDILFNNAGRSQRASFEEIELSVDKDMFDVNVFGPIHLTRTLVNYWYNKNYSGQIAVTSSVAGITGAPFSATYCATKFALHGYFESLKVEGYPKGIRITLFCPGPVFSRLLQSAFTAKAGATVNKSHDENAKRMATDRCARLCVVAVAHKLNLSWITMQPILVFLYVERYFYELGTMVMTRMMTKEKLMTLREGK